VNPVDLDVPGLAELSRRRSDKWSGHAPGVLAATIAEMDFPLAPPVAAALRAAIDRHDVGYAPGDPSRLRGLFAGFAGRRLGWTVDPDQVTLVPDVMAGLVELCRVLAAPGDGVAFATPAYPPFFTDLPQAGLALRELPLRADGALDLEALEAVLASGARVLVLANPHNPTGRVLPRAELAAIADCCAAHDAWVLADEIHAPLVLPGTEHTPWLEVSEAARRCGVALSSASKAFNLAGLKTALAVTASDRARAAVARMPDLSDRAGLLGVIAAEAAFADGDAWLDAVLARLDANRALLGERLAAELPEVRWTPPAATYLAWLDCRALGLGDDPAPHFLARGRVALSRGLDYGRPGAGFVRLNFGTSPELVAEAVARMAAVEVPRGAAPASRR
jgi:cysteine-S-conjugate beta-lyase